ncbi:pilus assembly PilX N-terminal domain-containing protein [Marinilactibacillus piezotolerans]|uniref:pilus assembly PilX N-terminal domain-containing protein n=1 Tax=Marinilactibacillus piezotolerans TaxID=258723 RepID=UPI0009B0A058|nr:pilus assembly PilX N-terminal domain-containing protein [Marinilactibacillus piezotolerans]
MNSKRSFKRIIKQENGSGLVLTLMVLMVLSVLGAALATVTIGSYRSTANNRNYVSAYYVAEAGLNQAYEEIKTAVKDAYELNDDQEAYFTTINSFLNSKSGASVNDFKSQFGENPKAEIKIETTTGGNPREYKLISTGKIGQATREISKIFTVEYKNKNSGGTLPDFPDNAVALIKSKMDILSGNIIGDLYLETVNPKTINLGWGNYKKSSLYLKPEAVFSEMATLPNQWYKVDSEGPYPKVSNLEFDWNQLDRTIANFPEFKDYSVPSDITIYQAPNDPYNKDHHNLIENGNLYVTDDLVKTHFDNLLLEQNVSFKNITFTNEYPLNIDTNGRDIIISVNNLDISNGILNIIGSGKVSIHVKNRLTFGAGTQVNMNGTVDQLKIFYKGDNPLKMSGGQSLKGTLFNLKSDLTLTGGAKVDGIVISGGKNVSFDGGTYSNAFVMAPYANVSLDSGAKVTGSLVGETLKMDGGASLEYLNLPTDFEIELDTDNSDQNIDLITGDPSIEVND